MSNSAGTILIAFNILIILISLWFSLVSLVYFIVAQIIGVAFSIKIASVIFLFTVIFKMFYPRNVFK